MLESGVISLDDIDLWTLEAVEQDKAERGRLAWLRMEAAKDSP